MAVDDTDVDILVWKKHHIRTYKLFTTIFTKSVSEFEQFTRFCFSLTFVSLHF